MKNQTVLTALFSTLLLNLLGQQSLRLVLETQYLNDCFKVEQEGSIEYNLTITSDEEIDLYSLRLRFDKDALSYEGFEIMADESINTSNFDGRQLSPGCLELNYRDHGGLNQFDEIRLSLKFKALSENVNDSSVEFDDLNDEMPMIVKVNQSNFDLNKADFLDCNKANNRKQVGIDDLIYTCFLNKLNTFKLINLVN